MSLLKSLSNALHRVSVYTGRAQGPQDLLTINDSQHQNTALSRVQEDPAGALRLAIRELTCHNDQMLAEPCKSQQSLQKTVHPTQTDIQLANWGAEQGSWGQRFAS